MAAQGQGTVSNVRQGIAGAGKTLLNTLRGGKAQWLTVLVLLLPAGWYLLSYLPSQEAYFTERNFRQLSLVSREFESKIDSSMRTLRNLAGEAQWQPAESISNWAAATITL